MPNKKTFRSGEYLFMRNLKNCQVVTLTRVFHIQSQNTLKLTPFDDDDDDDDDEK